MPDSGLLSTNDFAELSRTTPQTLLHYDRIGLLSPALRGENNFRCYSSGQLTLVNTIRTLQELGLSLAEIKRLKDHRTPESIDELLICQIKEIDKKIEDWRRARKLLFTLQKSIHAALNLDEKAITVQALPAEKIVLGDENDYSGGRDTDDALLSFYHAINKKYPDLDLNYSVWGLFTQERIMRGDWVWPDRYYFNNPEGRDEKPAALYAIGHARGGYGESDELYKRLTRYIDENNFEICGNAYEEYPLNEICLIGDRDYLMRVMIMVRAKSDTQSAEHVR